MDLKASIETKLSAYFAPQHLDVQDESAMHRNSQGQSHFKVIIVSTKFEKLKLIERHRMLHDLLKEQYQAAHAISLHAYTPSEWLNKQQTAPTSPVCRGGEKK